jgi:transposase
MATTSGLTRPQLSSDLGVGLSTLNKWVQQHQHDDLMSGPHEDVEKENTRLRKEVRLLRKEREVLKKSGDPMTGRVMLSMIPRGFFAGQIRCDLRSSTPGKKNGQLSFCEKLCGLHHVVSARGGCAYEPATA